MTIRESTKGRGMQDEISEVLKSPFYAQNSAPKALRDRILGPHSTQLVTVSRHYFRREPQVVVDFEPSPLEGKFYVEQKRIFFLEQSIVYVPIFLKETLSKEQFADRVREATTLMKLSRREINENGILRAVDIEELLQAPDVIEAIDRETLRRVEARNVEVNNGLRGIARVAAVKKYKLEVIAELREKARKGEMGSVFSSADLAAMAPR